MQRLQSSQSQEKSSPGDLVGVCRGDGYTTHETDDDIESEIVSEAGDIGDRALHSNRPSEHGSPCLSFCHGSENNRVALPISLPRNMSFQPYGFSSPASPLPKELASPTLVETGKRQQVEDKTLVSLSLSLSIYLFIFSLSLSLVCHYSFRASLARSFGLVTFSKL